ncbi:MAG: sugar phosphate nucleotidyltransferase [Fimbriimonadaceae bacterium]
MSTAENKAERETVKAVVMAGGEGSRLRPLTSNLPKPMVPIGNQPIMEHILTLLKRHGITEVIATIHYLGDEIRSYFGDGSDFGVDLQYSVETSPLGTAGSVKRAEAMLREGTFLIISGDALTDCDLDKALEFHREKRSKATIVLSRVPNPLEFGVVITAEDGRIERFLEKPGWSEVFSDTVNTGIYILEPEIFNRMEPNQPADWSADVFPQLLADGAPIYGYVMNEYWCDIGSLSQYREAQEDLLSRRVNLPIIGGEATSDGSGRFVGPNCTIDEEVHLIPPVCIGRNCRIKRGARIGPYSSIGDNAHIEEEAHIERSVVWDNVYIGPNVGIHSATVGSRCTIKRDTVIREDAVVGDRCFIDVGCTIRPRIKIWPDKSVERGSTVTMSLVWGARWRASLFRELGVAGLSNIELTPDFACRLAAAYGSTLQPGSKVITSRDSTRSSRMIKRAVIAALLSAGCDVLDLRSTALPIARHYIQASGAAGAVNVRKLPGNNRVTLVELMDPRGAYLSRSAERKVESAFFREDYRRADPDALGTIEFASRAVEEYQADFFRLLQGGEQGRRLRIACDYGFSSLATYYPAMLGRLGVESIAINSFNDAKRSPRTKEEVGAHVENLKHIVGTLSYDIGVLFLEDGERLVLVDDRGEVIEGATLLAVFCAMVVRTNPKAKVALSVTAPSKLEEYLRAGGAEVIRTKADVRSLLTGALEECVDFAGDDRGGFMSPSLQAGFDAPFAFGKLVVMLQQTGLALGQVVAEVPQFQLAYEAVRVPWDAKGAVMRRLAEESRDGQVELFDGIKIVENDSWVLVLPDALEPLVHLYAESPNQDHSKDLVADYAKRIDEFQAAAV